jgi:hypothetical protein
MPKPILTATQLHEGAALHSLVHAVVISKWPDFDNEVSWEKRNYSRQNSEGGYGTVSFLPDGSLVAAFYDEDRKPVEQSKVFAGCPPKLLAVAKKQTLQYLLLDFDDPKKPMVSAALWSTKDGSLKGAQPWAKLSDGGAHLLERELLPADQAIDGWAEDAELSKPQIKALKAVWPRRAISAAEAKLLGLKKTPSVKQLLAGAGIKWS